MDKGLLDKDSLIKDIAKIEYYSEEEKKSLNRIYTMFDECCKIYKSKNVDLIYKNCNQFLEDIEAITVKRRSYSDVLNRVIRIYDEMSEETTRFFNGGLE